MARLTPLQEQKRQFTRTRLVEAAREVFVERGYAAATVDHIAAAAGASRATFYLHFDNKTAVAAELLSTYREISMDRYRALDHLLVSSSAGKRKRLRKWLKDWLALWRDNAGLYQSMLAAQNTDPQLERRAMDSSVGFIDALEKHLGSLPAAKRKDVRARAIVLEQMTRTAFSLSTRAILPVAEDVMLDFLTDTWAGVLLEQAER